MWQQLSTLCGLEKWTPVRTEVENNYFFLYTALESKLMYQKGRAKLKLTYRKEELS